MGAYQTSAIQNASPLIIGGEPYAKDSQTILQIAGRTVTLADRTVMAQIASSGKWAPWLNANLGATDGSQIPAGILMGDFSAASLAAGDVTAVNILVGGAGVCVDTCQLVFDGGDSGGGTLNTLDSIPTVPTNLALRAEVLLNMRGIYPVSTVALDLAEN